MERFSWKLDFLGTSLYKIIQQISNTFKFQLLDLIKIYFIFSPNRLYKVSQNPFLG
jgi:hypothetical protein